MPHIVLKTIQYLDDKKQPVTVAPSDTPVNLPTGIAKEAEARGLARKHVTAKAAKKPEAAGDGKAAADAEEGSGGEAEE